MKTIQVGGHKRNSKIMWAMVDDEDFELASQYKWSIDKNGRTNYAINKNFGKKIRLHRLILGLNFTDKRVVNHKDGNGLNNQRSNIEACSQLYNCQSINKINGNKGTIGYVENHKYKPWRSRITIDKIKYSKYFSTEEEAKQFIADLLDTAKAFYPKVSGN